MRKPNKLNTGDTVAIVSLSSGIGGEDNINYRYEIGKQRLEDEFGLNVITMPNALRGVEFLDKHPELRAKDLMDAFRNDRVKAIITMIGGDDTIRLLPYVDFNVIKQNPKIFMGYSDTTVNHLMMFKAGLVSFYGPAVLSEFAENIELHSYTKKSIEETLFKKNDRLNILPSSKWTSQMLPWEDKNNAKIKRTTQSDSKGYELLQGVGTVTGELLGGCLGVFPMVIGTDLWPTGNDWNGKILFLETSEDLPTPANVTWILRGLAAQGLFRRIHGIIVGKPLNEKYYEDYKTVFRKVVAEEEGLTELPILYNCNFGHTAPMCILPYGCKAEIDCDNEKFTLLESGII